MRMPPVAKRTGFQLCNDGRVVQYYHKLPYVQGAVETYHPVAALMSAGYETKHPCGENLYISRLIQYTLCVHMLSEDSLPIERRYCNV